jgi:hypothetical protein
MRFPRRLASVRGQGMRSNSRPRSRDGAAAAVMVCDQHAAAEICALGQRSSSAAGSGRRTVSYDRSHFPCQHQAWHDGGDHREHHSCRSSTGRRASAAWIAASSWPVSGAATLPRAATSLGVRAPTMA